MPRKKNMKNGGVKLKDGDIVVIKTPTTNEYLRYDIRQIANEHIDSTYIEKNPSSIINDLKFIIEFETETSPTYFRLKTFNTISFKDKVEHCYLDIYSNTEKGIRLKIWRKSIKYINNQLLFY